ncbi:DUF4252 domain-containing protein [Flavobacterium sp. '19STA2R22 D10 B1']|uniref:DUF4252 domain-containing protein n=1 Tax=Flavobacterium aerium TaxID=3037261 RepID=UPI00278C7828|nr:DUF4252 domain-containing protein [Flavobacterium sp. '19STA2R22 D10 B1']
MKKIIYTLTLVCSLLIVSCDNSPSLQKYFVKNTDSKEFIALDLSPSILKLDEKQLTAQEKSALAAIDKMNILAYKADSLNQPKFDKERAEVKAILKDPKYQDLFKVGSGKEGASVQFVGEDDHIKEFVLFGNSKDFGFAIVRVLGKDMNVNQMMTVLGLLKKSNIDMEQLKPLKGLLEQGKQ